MKGITINGIHSYNDLDLMIAEREISVAKPNRITESVPYQNGEYDFSNINGEVTYENRDISYTFDIGELTTEEMEVKKREILNWVAGLVDVDIYDDYLPDYHFVGSFDSVKWEEDFGQGEIEIIFSVYPYMYANSSSYVSYDIEESLEVTLTTNSSHRVIPTVTSTSDMLITYGTTTLAIGEGSYSDVSFYLDKSNSFTFTGTGTVTFSWTDEVL